MRNMEHALRYLRAVEKKHKNYFSEQKLKILDCVDLTNLDTRMHIVIIKDDLPTVIQDELHAMFWL